MQKYRLCALLIFSLFSAYALQAEDVAKSYHEEQVDEDDLYIQVLEALAERKGLQENPGRSFADAALERIATANIPRKTQAEWAILLRVKDNGYLQKYALIASSEGLKVLPKKIEDEGFTLGGYDASKPAIVRIWKDLIVKAMENRDNLLKSERELFNKTFLMAHNSWILESGKGRIFDGPGSFIILAANESKALYDLAFAVTKNYELEDLKNDFPIHLMYGSQKTREIIAAFMKYAAVAPSHDFVQRAYYYGLKAAHTKEEVDRIVEMAIVETLIVYPPTQFNDKMMQEGLKYIEDSYAKPEDMEKIVNMNEWAQQHNS